MNQQDLQLISSVLPQNSTDEGQELAFIEALVREYRRVNEERTIQNGSMWADMFGLFHSPLHHIWLKERLSEWARVFQNPHESDFFRGFETLTKQELARLSRPDQRSAYLLECLEIVLFCAQAFGVRRLIAQQWHTSGQLPVSLDEIEELLNGIEARARHGLFLQNTKLCFPNPWPHEIGLLTSRGLMSDKCLQSFYYAWRANQLLQACVGCSSTSREGSPVLPACPSRGENRVLEIGAGIGRTAYYAVEFFGVNKYVIVDLPVVCMASAYFLGRTRGFSAEIGEQGIFLASVHILSPQMFLGDTRKNAVVINTDSLTEMSKSVAEAYFSHIQRTSTYLYSVNHEGNSLRVRDFVASSISKGTCICLSSAPYWMRRGYVEEIFYFPQNLNQNANECTV